MAQLRQDEKLLREHHVEVLVIGPDSDEAFRSFWQENQLTFPGLPDPRGSVLKLYGQEVNLFKLGRMPAQVMVDKEGKARFVHYGHSMSDIPATQDILKGIE